MEVLLITDTAILTIIIGLSAMLFSVLVFLLRIFSIWTNFKDKSNNKIKNYLDKRSKRIIKLFIIEMFSLLLIIGIFLGYFVGYINGLTTAISSNDKTFFALINYGIFAVFMIALIFTVLISYDIYLKIWY